MEGAEICFDHDSSVENTNTCSLLPGRYFSVLLYIFIKYSFLKGSENNSQRKPQIFHVWVTETIELISSNSLLSHVTDTVLSISCFTAFHPIYSQLPVSNADLRQSWNTFNLWEEKLCRDAQLSAAFASYTLPQPVR